MTVLVWHIMSLDFLPIQRIFCIKNILYYLAHQLYDYVPNLQSKITKLKFSAKKYLTSNLKLTLWSFHWRRLEKCIFQTCKTLWSFQWFPKSISQVYFLNTSLALWSFQWLAPKMYFSGAVCWTKASICSGCRLRHQLEIDFITHSNSQLGIANATLTNASP